LRKLAARSAWFFCLLAAVASLAAVGAGAAQPLRVGLTPIIPYDEIGLDEDLRHYLEDKLGRQVEFVRRDSYRPAMDMVAHDQIDAAWVSVYPYVYLQRNYNLRLLATPVYRGQPFFRTYLIVPAEDKSTRSILQLEGKIFAYADPYSFSGYLYPRYELHEAGKDARTFFSKTFFTRGHKRVVRAVASGLADGGYVDGYIWDSLAIAEPQLTAKTRIVEMSGLHGFPPLVAANKMSDREFTELRGVLIAMSSDPAGIKLLKRLGLDGFVAGDPKWYAEAAQMMHVMGDI
jgi:phosphonate transport system substrate-binding protein